MQSRFPDGSEAMPQLVRLLTKRASKPGAKTVGRLPVRDAVLCCVLLPQLNAFRNSFSCTTPSYFPFLAPHRVHA